MRRFLQLAGNVSLRPTVRSRATSLIDWHHYYQTNRAISGSFVALARRNDSSSSSSKRGGNSSNATEGMNTSASKTPTTTDGKKKKKGFLEMASEKLYEMSSGVGSPPKSTSKPSGSRMSERQIRSSSSRQAAGDRKNLKRPKDSSPDAVRGKQTKKSSGRRGATSFGDHRAMGSVQHDREAHRFTLDLGNNQVARIDYKQAGKNLLELYHTEVPEKLRGRGIGKSLARGALECIARDNLKARVTCEYLDDYVRRFADAKHKKLLAK